MIGVVIGKGGDMIKKIQQESGSRIQFRPEDEQGGPNRMCNLTGSVEQTQAAASMIQELIESTAVCMLLDLFCFCIFEDSLKYFNVITLQCSMIVDHSPLDS